MGVTGYSAEFTSPVSPTKLFKGTVLDLHKICPKAMPQFVKSASPVGDGDENFVVGSLVEYHFTDDFPFQYELLRFDKLDKDNFECIYSLIEGGHLGTKNKSQTYHNKVEAAPNGGSVCKLEVKMDTLDGVELSKEELDKECEGMVQFYKTVEGYILANPDA